jgi:threonine dehydratase
MENTAQEPTLPDAPRLTRDDVERARRVLAPHLPPTPLRRCEALPDLPLFLKLECWQPTGSFKVRGALHALASLPPDVAARGVVAASAGNHALGVAWAAATLGGRVPATLFVPARATRAKVAKLRRFPVTLVETGASYDEAYEAAVAHAERGGARYVHACDDPLTVAGQGTVGLEIEDALSDVGTVVVPTGGGGLLAGLAVAMKARRPDLRIVAVQAEASPSLRESLRVGRALLTYDAAPTLADGLAGGIGAILFAHRDLVDEVVEVSEDEIEDAIAALLVHDQVLAEGSGAAALAALRSGKARVDARDGRPVVAIVSGANLDARVLARILGARA